MCGPAAQRAMVPTRRCVTSTRAQVQRACLRLVACQEVAHDKASLNAITRCWRRVDWHMPRPPKLRRTALRCNWAHVRLTLRLQLHKAHDLLVLMLLGWGACVTRGLQIGGLDQGDLQRGSTGSWREKSHSEALQPCLTSSHSIGGT
jgi:hypothetical protein